MSDNPFVNSRADAIAMLNSPSIGLDKHLGGPDGSQAHPDGSPQTIHGGGKKKTAVKVETDKPETKSITFITFDGDIQTVKARTPDKFVSMSIETVAQDLADSGYDVDSPQIYLVGEEHTGSGSQFGKKILLRDSLFDKDGKPTDWGGHVIAHEYLHNRKRVDGTREHDRDWPFDRVEESAVDLLALKAHAKDKDWRLEPLAYRQHVGLLIRSFRKSGLNPSQTWKAIDDLQKVGRYRKFYKEKKDDPFWVKQVDEFLGGVKNPPGSEDADKEMAWLFGETQKSERVVSFSTVRDQIETAVMRGDLKAARLLLSKIPAEMKDQVDWMVGEFHCRGERVSKNAVASRRGMVVLPRHSALFKHCGTCPEDDAYFGAIPERQIRIEWETHGANQMEVISIRAVGKEARAALWKPLTGERPDLQQAIGGPLCFREEATCLMDRALGFYLVPVTYTQEVNGMVGAVVHYVHHLGERKEATEYASEWIERSAVLDFLSGQTDRGDHNWKTHPDDSKRPVIFDNGLSFPTSLKKIRSAFIVAWGDRAISPDVLDSVESLYRNTALWDDLFKSLGDPATSIAVLRVRLLLELGSIPGRLIVEEELHKAYPKDKCMGCGDATPVKRVRWANGKAIAWFCQPCYAAWREEHEDDIDSVEDIAEPQDLTKHLPGKHDQKEHGRKGAKRTEDSLGPRKMSQASKDIVRRFSKGKEEKFVRSLEFTGISPENLPRIFEVKDRRTGFVTKIDEVVPLEDEVKFYINRLDKRGRNNGYMQISTKPDKSIFVDAVDFSKESATGHGVRIMKHLEDQFRALGKTSISLETMEVGGYAWARMGFDFNTDGDRAYLTRQLSEKYKKRYGKSIKLKGALHSWDIASFVGPDGYALGKKIMLDSEWGGTKSLDPNSLSYKVGLAYYGTSSKRRARVSIPYEREGDDEDNEEEEF